MVINTTTLINPLTKVVKYILNKVGLQDSNLFKQMQINITLDRVVISMPNYAVFVDSGRKPNSKMPPVSDILNWIRRKNISVPNMFTKESFAFAIAKSIAKKGIKPRPFLTQLRENCIDIIKQYMQSEIQNAMLLKLTK